MSAGTAGIGGLKVADSEIGAPGGYEAFLRGKVKLAATFGFPLDECGEINPVLKPHQAAIVRWLVAGGRRACFAAFGLGKTPMQLETIRLVLAKTGGRGLIVCPLGVRQEFVRDAVKLLGWAEPPRFIRSIDEAGETGIYLTNYETVRDGKLDPCLFSVASLDEASILRGFGGSKTFREFMRLFTGDAGPAAGMKHAAGKSEVGGRKSDNAANAGDGAGAVGFGQSRAGSATAVPYRFVATATPSPNEYIELLAYAEFLGIMDVSQAKTRFFKRDSTKADVLTLHPHKEREFWLWVSSWALFVQKPSDLGFSDEGYALPPITVNWHEVPTDHRDAGHERSGQGRIFRDAAIGVQDAAAEKRRSLPSRIGKLLELRAEDPAAHRIIWHDLEAEREAIEAAVPGVVSVYGSQDLDEREAAIMAFSDGKYPELSTKPVIAGSGCNFQRHCAWAIFLGIGFKFNDFIQAIHRIQRFLQEKPVRIDLIYTEAEREVRKQLERKWTQHNEMVKQMTQIIRQHGLSEAAMAKTLTRNFGVERVEVTGERYTLVNNDCVLETRRLAENSVGLVLTSIPFSTQYEYSPNYADFGHSEGNAEFFDQMDYLTPELLRVLEPGRIAAIHVKDRIVPGGMTGLGFQTVYPFHMHCIQHYTRHGFAYMGMKTIVTDVVRENNQTYRLGWTEQCKDGTKMGVGMPEYLLLFRKPPTDTSNSYGDRPVVKPKADTERYECSQCGRAELSTEAFLDKSGDDAERFYYKCPSCGCQSQPQAMGVARGYTRSRWQIDAHGFTRSAGNRLMMPEELKGLTHQQIFRLFRDFSLSEVYDFEHHVRLGEALEGEGKLPVTFMLLQPQSWQDDVWTDITRMLTLNGSQHAKGKEMHLCPMQFDIADRVIEQFSMPGDLVLDPFGGLMTVPLRAIKAGRRGMGFELNPGYFLDGAAYCKAMEQEMAMPSLFDTVEVGSQRSEVGDAAVEVGSRRSEVSGDASEAEAVLHA